MATIVIGGHGFDRASPSATGLTYQIFQAWNERVWNLNASALPCAASSYSVRSVPSAWGSGVFGYGKYLNVGDVLYFAAGLTPNRWRAFQFHFFLDHIDVSRWLWAGTHGTTHQWRVKYNATSHRLELWDDGEINIIAQGHTDVSAGWHYCRMKVNTAAYDDSPPGYHCLQIDGNQQWEVTGVDLINAGLPGIAHLAFNGGVSHGQNIDNLLILGTDDNSEVQWESECAELAPAPVGDHVLDWTPNGAATGYQCVDETTPDGDVTCITDGTVGHRALFQAEPISAPYGILYVALDAYARKDNTEDRGLTLAAKVGGVVTTGAESADLLSQSYLSRTRFMTEKPAGGAWAESDYNTSYWGPEVAS